MFRELFRSTIRFVIPLCSYSMFICSQGLLGCDAGHGVSYVCDMSQTPANQGYPEAVRILYDRFGKPHDVGKAATTELFAGLQVLVGDTAGLTDLVTQMRECSVTLEQFNQKDQLNFLNLVKVVEKLPQPVQERWAEADGSITSCRR